jgi:hypothetical protein
MQSSTPVTVAAASGPLVSRWRVNHVDDGDTFDARRGG